MIIEITLESLIEITIALEEQKKKMSEIKSYCKDIKNSISSQDKINEFNRGKMSVISSILYQIIEP